MEGEVGAFDGASFDGKLRFVVLIVGVLINTHPSGEPCCSSDGGSSESREAAL